MNAYTDYAKMTLLENDRTWTLDFDECKYDEMRTIKEFENYLIGLENG